MNEDFVNAEDITRTAGEPEACIAPAATPETEEKRFTQGELERILSERLSKERAKHDLAMKQFRAELAHKERVAEISLRLNQLRIDCPELAEGFAGLDDGTLEQRLTAVSGALQRAVDGGIQERLQGMAPKTGAVRAANPAAGIRQAMGLHER